jgi:serine/threonine-protein kinase RsbW
MLEKTASPTVRKASRKPMTEIIELSINSKYELVDKIGSVTRSVTNRMSFDEDTAGWIDLAVREAVINAIKHGNKNLEAKQVDVRFELEPGNMTVFVRDRGTGFDPTSLPDPLDPSNILNPAGRGIFFMRTFMDEVEYSAHPEGGSIVRMKKHKP